MKVECATVNEFIEMMQLLKDEKYIFGAGTYGKIFGKFFDDNLLAWNGYIDNNVELQQKVVNGKRVYSLHDD